MQNSTTRKNIILAGRIAWHRMAHEQCGRMAAGMMLRLACAYVAAGGYRRVYWRNAAQREG